MFSNFNLELFKSLLGNNKFSNHILYIENCVSTQMEAKHFVARNGVANALFIADGQQNGRGRLNRTWSDAETASLTFSILLHPKIPICSVALINFAAGLAVKRLLALRGIDTELKWPNDILFSGKKLCGILSEAATVCDSLFFIVTGIGLNVNSEVCDFPSDISATATSLKIITGRDFSREKLLADFLPLFESYIALIENNAELFLETYRANCDTLGKIVKVITTEREFIGKAESITSAGAIVIENKNGEKQSFFAADIIHIRST